jgi:hypothetical protein
MAEVYIDEHDEFRCSCGNYPNAEGAYPSDREGTEVPQDQNFADLWCCDRCGVIFRAPAGLRGSCEIVGQGKERPNHD